MTDVTRILASIERGDPHAAAQLLPLVYDELRRLAVARMAHERPDHTLQATALVHEAFLRLVGTDDAGQWDGRAHFFAAAAEAMRRILVENARRKASRKAGGDLQRVDLPEIEHSIGDNRVDLIALDDVLSRLEEEHPAKAQIIKLRFFAGLSLDETAAVLGISRATAQRDWAYARAWLFGRLKDT